MDPIDVFAALAPDTTCWPARWIARDDQAPTPHVTLFRLRFTLDAAWSGHLHVSGDEWFELFLDGALLIRGPGISSPRRWLYDRLACPLAPGEHTLLARVFALGDELRPEPVMSVRPGFLCCPDPADPLLAHLATGLAPWQWSDASSGWTFSPPGICNQQATACGPMHQELPAVGTWPPSAADDPPWSASLASRPAHIGSRTAADGALFPNAGRPATQATITGLRVRVVDQAGWHTAYGGDSPEAGLALIAGGRFAIPAGQRRRILIDADAYLLGFVHLDVQAARGASLAMTWTERLMTQVGTNDCWGGEIPRHRIDGLFVVGPRDTWRMTSAGRWHLTTPFQRCGRYVELVAEAGPEGPLVLSGFRFEDGLPPSPLMPLFTCDHPLLAGIQPACRRVLETGLRSAFCDCPYYEQVQWVGDLYPILLCHLAAGRDEPVYRQALALVADSVQGQHPTQARFPIRPEAGQSVILSFSLWYVVMVHDYARWRGHRDFVRSLMPTLRRNVELFLAHLRDDGLCATPPGWNYVDWASGWRNGCPPVDDHGVSGVLNLLIARTCRKLAALEAWLDEPELANRWRRHAEGIARACHARLWDDQRGCYRDAPGIAAQSEHVQALALLDPALPAEREAPILAALDRSLALDFCTRPGQLTALKPFFSHHLFEALVQRRRSTALWRRLAAWQCILDLDLRTTPESMPGTRSDCHGWSAHPLFHAIASCAGIRPAAFGFAAVDIAPQPGPIRRLATTVWTPHGDLTVDGRLEDGTWTMQVILPEGLPGTFTAPGGSPETFTGTRTFRWRVAST